MDIILFLRLFFFIHTRRTCLYDSFFVQTNNAGRNFYAGRRGVRVFFSTPGTRRRISRDLSGGLRPRRPQKKPIRRTTRDDGLWIRDVKNRVTHRRSSLRYSGTYYRGTHTRTDLMQHYGRTWFGLESSERIRVIQKK